MKFLKKERMNKRNRQSLLCLFLLLVLLCWYQGIYLSVHHRMEAAATRELEQELKKEQAEEIRLHTMQEEIEKNRMQNAPIVPSYNHFKQEVEELNRIFADAHRFDFRFSEPQADGMQVRRRAAITFEADTYDAAVQMLRELSEGSYRISLQDLSISSAARQNAGTIQEGAVLVSFQMTFYETLYDAGTEEGLTGIQKEAEKQEMGTLGRSPMEQ